MHDFFRKEMRFLENFELHEVIFFHIGFSTIYIRIKLRFGIREEIKIARV